MKKLTRGVSSPADYGSRPSALKPEVLMSSELVSLNTAKLRSQRRREKVA